MLKPSSIKPAIATVEQKLVLKNLGKLSPEDLLSMDNMLRELLDLGAK